MGGVKYAVNNLNAVTMISVQLFITTWTSRLTWPFRTAASCIPLWPFKVLLAEVKAESVGAMNKL